MLQKLEDNPDDARSNQEFEREVRVSYELFRDIVDRVRDQKWTRNKQADGQKDRPSRVP